MSNKIVRLGADYFDGGWLLSNPDLNIAPNLLFLCPASQARIFRTSDYEIIESRILSLYFPAYSTARRNYIVGYILTFQWIIA